MGLLGGSLVPQTLTTGRIMRSIHRVADRVEIAGITVTTSESAATRAGEQAILRGVALITSA